MSEKLKGASTVGDVLPCSKTELIAALGQAAGESVYWGVRGVEKEERQLVGVLSESVEGDVGTDAGVPTGRKSVSAEINVNFVRFYLLYCSDI